MFGEKLPLLPLRYISNTKETYSNYNLLSISSSHRAPLFCQKIPNFCDIIDHITGVRMDVYGNIPEIFRNYFQRNADVHDHNLRNANGLHVA